MGLTADCINRGAARLPGRLWLGDRYLEALSRRADRRFFPMLLVPIVAADLISPTDVCHVRPAVMVESGGTFQERPVRV